MYGCEAGTWDAEDRTKGVYKKPHWGGGGTCLIYKGRITMALARAFFVSEYCVGCLNGSNDNIVIEITYQRFAEYSYPWSYTNYTDFEESEFWNRNRQETQVRVVLNTRQTLEVAMAILDQHMLRFSQYGSTRRGEEIYTPYRLTTTEKDFQGVYPKPLFWPIGDDRFSPNLALEFKHEPRTRSLNRPPKYEAGMFVFPYLSMLHIARSILLNFSETIPQDKYLRILFLEIWQRLKDIENKHTA